MRTEKSITLQEILELHPCFSATEEIYCIKTSDGDLLYLEVYENSDFGCEYTLYNKTFDDIDGGVIDECEAEDENAVAQLILELLEEMNVHGISISKLPFETENEEELDVFSVQEKAQKRWEEKVKVAKSVLIHR